MKKILILVAILAPTFTFAQKFYLRDRGQAIDKKLSAALRYDYELVDSASSDYTIEAFYKGSYNFWKNKNYSGYYKIYDKSGREVYRSEEFSFAGYGGTVENKIVKRIVEKDLPQAMKRLKQ